MASLLRLRSGRREWRGRRRDDLTQLTYEEHRTLSKVLHESLKTFKATLDYAEMDEGSSVSDSDISDDSSDILPMKSRKQSKEETSDLDFVPRGKNFDYALRPVAANQNKKSNAAVASNSSTTKIGKPTASDLSEGRRISKSTKDGRNSISRYPYSLRRRRQVVEQSSSNKSSNISSDESDEQNHRISARSSVKKTKSKGEHASTSTEDIEATATELFLYFAFSGRPMQLEWMDRLPLLRVNHLT
ncbi:Isoleucine--tRNA ligase [Trichinella pseudospiralis]